jgi:DNA-binding LytR/AlgR family response regulator
MNCIIVEDDELSIIAIKKCIERSENLQLKEVFNSSESALEYLKNNSCNILFLDIEMPGMNGIELIRKLTNTPHVVIISSKKDYAADAFNFDVVDYIVKPLSYERFQKAINKINKIEENIKFSENTDFIYIKNEGKLMQLHYNEILYVEALADYVNIYTSTKRYVVLSTMKGIESQLPASEFMRVHRSFVVRLDKIKEIDDNNLKLDGKIIPVSRSNRSEFRKRIKQI